jgi:uncharacterized metal-binding protein YceD (DUF177 family)
LFSSTQLRVLALLFGQPDRSFFTSEIIGHVSAGSGAVQRQLTRLTEAIRLSCDWADESRKIPRLSGDVTAEVAATCQRCLEPFWLPVATELRYLLLPATGGRIADSAVDVWELEDDTIRLLDIVEESLIMALPLAATHGPEDACGVQADDSRDEPLELAKPFAGLRTQMDKLN